MILNSDKLSFNINGDNNTTKPDDSVKPNPDTGGEDEEDIQ